MSKALGWTLNKLNHNNAIKGIQISKGDQTTTHQQFVNDVMLYGEANLKEAKTLKFILSAYMCASGKNINLSKLEIYFSILHPL